MTDALREALRELVDAWDGGINTPIPAWHKALDNARTALQEPAPVVAREPGHMKLLIEALMNYRQADEDGVVVTVSRQACHEAADILRSLTAPQAPVEPAPVVQPSRSESLLWQALGQWTVTIAQGGVHAELAPPQYVLDAVAALAAPSQLVEDARRYRTLLEYMTVDRDEPGEWTCWLHLACIPFRSKTEDPAELVDKLVTIHAERSIAKGVES